MVVEFGCQFFLILHLSLGVTKDRTMVRKEAELGCMFFQCEQHNSVAEMHYKPGYQVVEISAT